jgi:Ca2+-binding RTX toxin-like protein
VAKNNTDGGYDIKSSNTVLVRALAEGNTENYRFWTNPASVEGLTSIDATYYGGTGRATHIWLADNAQAMIAGGTITEPDPIESIFDIGTGAELIVQGAIIVKTGDTPFKSGNGILTGLSEWPPTTQAINGTNKGDALTGTSANDLINGKSGDDKILAKDGSDVLIGDAGKDAFIFDTKLGSANVDIIVDFNTADDTIRIDDKMFTKIKTGQLPSSAFVIGEKALDSDDRIIYNDKTGALYHDPDGTGSAAAVKFAVIENLAKLSAVSFVVF